MENVLVLNQDYTPLTLCSVERAFLLLYLDKADLLSEVKEKSLRSIDRYFPYPSVIRVRRYVQVPYKGVILTRHNVFKRDGFTCQYCGTGSDLTLDHVVPRSKGGKSTWTNLATACKTCNAKKGDFTPEEAGLTLAKKPVKPSYVVFLKSTTKNLREDWLPFLERQAIA